MTTLATVNAHALAAAGTCQAKDDVRYYLNGILVSPIKTGGVHIVATNGHRMIVITDPDGTCEKPIIITFEPAALTKMRQIRAETVLIKRVDNETVIATIEGLNHISNVKLIDGKYPDWESVMPGKLPSKSNFCTTFNSEYMANFANAAKYLRVKNNAMAFVNGSTDMTTICILFGPCHRQLHAQGVLMPLKFEGAKTWWKSL